MSIGYFVDLADADLYFVEERLETYAWDDLDTNPSANLKQKVIRMAYNRLYHDPRWTLPTYALATVAERIKLRIANAEMAYYFAIHLEDEDDRKGLQAQGVIEAGIVKEKYSEAALQNLPVPPAVISMLTPWAVPDHYIGMANLARNEEESVDTKVHEF